MCHLLRAGVNESWIPMTFYRRSWSLLKPRGAERMNSVAFHKNSGRTGENRIEWNGMERKGSPSVKRIYRYHTWWGRIRIWFEWFWMSWLESKLMPSQLLPFIIQVSWGVEGLILTTNLGYHVFLYWCKPFSLLAYLVWFDGKAFIDISLWHISWNLLMHFLTGYTDWNTVLSNHSLPHCVSSTKKQPPLRGVSPCWIGLLNSTVII